MILTGQLNGFTQILDVTAAPKVGDTVTYAGFLYQNTASTLLSAEPGQPVNVRCYFGQVPTLTTESGQPVTTEAGDGIVAV